MNHRAKKARHMSQPAVGNYIDCTCGRRGGIYREIEDAKADHERHVAEEATPREVVKP